MATLRTAQSAGRWAPPPVTASTSAAAAAAAARRLRWPHPRGMPCARSNAAPSTRHLWRRAAAGGSGSGDGEGIDIDALAARLSQEAEKLRQSGASLSSEDEGDSDSADSDAAAYEAQPDARRQEALRREAAAGGPQPDLLPVFGYASQSAEAEALAAVGSGGFSPEEFELLSELGTINIQQVRRHCCKALSCVRCSRVGRRAHLYCRCLRAGECAWTAFVTCLPCKL